MECISFKLDDAFAREIEKAMRLSHYSTKTEFIRDSIRDKLKLLAEERAKRKAWQALFAARGIFKGQGKAKTEEEWHKFRGDMSKEILEHYQKKFGLNLK